MGGICAVIGEPGDPGLAERLERMLARSPYRGAAQRHLEGGLALGIQSLGWDASLASYGNWLVAVHGWIGNWDELAASLRLDLPGDASNAHRIALAYESLGDRLFAKLRGEFAIVILDRRAREVVALRDVVGCRPLFHHAAMGRLIIASEVRQVLAGSGEPPAMDDRTMVRHLLDLAPSAGPTCYRGVSNVVPPRVVRFSADDPTRRASSRLYWEPPAEDRRPVSLDEAEGELRRRLDRAVARALPERPFSVSLSGGLDSSTVWALIGRQAREGSGPAAGARACSLCYPGLGCDETELIRSTVEATGSEAELLDVSAVRAVDAYSRLARELDHPFGATLYQLPILCDSALASGRDVLLTGLGGDDWLGGFPGYLLDELLRGRLLTVLRDVRELRIPEGRSRAWFVLTRAFTPGWGLRRRFSRPSRPAWLAASWWPPQAALGGDRGSEEPLRNATRSRLGLLTMLRPHQRGFILGCIEQCAAVSGVEVRHPLMDLDIVELAFATSGRAFLAGGAHKGLLRRAMGGLLPALVLERRKTRPFDEVIVRDWPRVAADARGSRWVLVERGILDQLGLDKTVGSNTLGEDATFRFIDRLYISELVARERLDRGSFEGNTR